MARASILLVEDEENLHEALKMNLELEGYEVTSAFDGIQAMKAVQNEYFDLIIMDVMIPEVDGFSVTQNIRLTNTEVPILILSAKDSSADRVTGLKILLISFRSSSSFFFFDCGNCLDGPPMILN